MWMNIYIHNVIVIVIVAVIVIVVVIVITHTILFPNLLLLKTFFALYLYLKITRVYTKYYILLHAKLLDSIFMTCTAINSALSLVML